MRIVGLLLTLTLAFGMACGGEDGATPTAPIEAPAELEVRSNAFAEGEVIPPAYTCDGENRSPHLAWSGVPEETRSFVILVDDPDAPGGSFTHWLVFDLPADSEHLEPGVGNSSQLPGDARHGENDAAESGYSGPCPPGERHEYVFRVFALDSTLGLEAGVSRATVVSAMREHVLAEGALRGVYKR